VRCSLSCMFLFKGKREEAGLVIGSVIITLNLGKGKKGGEKTETFIFAHQFLCVLKKEKKEKEEGRKGNP